MPSVNQKIKEVKALDQSKLQPWEVKAIQDAEASNGELQWGEIDVINEIHWRAKNA